jgi:Cu(I)/Ag(I) efflux system membrane fusion protein
MNEPFPTPARETPGPSAPPPSIHTPPPGARFMNGLRWVLFAFLMVLAISSTVGYALSRRPATATKHVAATVIYQCPMHPSYTSDRPGECPICGMTLEPVTIGAQGQTHAADERAGDVPGLTSVHVTPDRQQLIGVRFARVERAPLGGELELVGFVTPDESALKRVQIRVSGWVRRLYVNQTGAAVKIGQPLLTIYSPELFQTEQEFLIEQGGADSLARLAPPTGAAAQRLRLLEVPDEEIQRLQRERKAVTELALRSPVDGTVLERGVVEGQYVGADTPLLTVADLSRVWVMADLYEMDFTRVKVGDRARFTADALVGRSFDARVQFVYPTVSDETRTLKARLALDNRDGALRPGMYGRVRVLGRAAMALSVPSEAVVNTGEHSYVFVAHVGGNFEPRLVWTGMPEGDRVQILRGVAAGDTVVASATFLMDSESRLKAAVAGSGSMPNMPGMEHSQGATP